MTFADVDLTDLDRFAAGFPHEAFTPSCAARPASVPG
jgi:hypothetical protein